jgi:hypothetical protein
MLIWTTDYYTALSSLETFETRYTWTFIAMYITDLIILFFIISLPVLKVEVADPFYYVTLENREDAWDAEHESWNRWRG